MDPSHFQSQQQVAHDSFQAVGPALRVLQLNVEGLSSAKRVLIGQLATQHKADVICLQETHIAVDEAARFTISGFDLICYDLHPKHGRATYAKSDLADVYHVASSTFYDSVSVGIIQLVNVYKPPSASWDDEVLPSPNHPAVYIGDFNCRHQDWGYSSTCADGSILADWASVNDLSLLYDPKQPGSFHSARWNKDSSPDLCWVSTANGQALPATRHVLKDFPHSQHRPVIIHIGLQLPVIPCSEKLRWNFRKANWCLFGDLTNKFIPVIPINSITTEESYRRFRQAIFKAASHAIPRGRRANYTPCLDAECEQLLKQYEESGDIEVADQLIASLDAARQARWLQLTESLDFTHSSKKAWKLLHRLDAGSQPPPVFHPPVSPNSVASHLTQVGRAKIDPDWKREISHEWKSHLRLSGPAPKPSPFTLSELEDALKKVKPGTAAGYDNITPELIINLGPVAKKWLTAFLSYVIESESMPKIWRRAKIIAVLKPKKDPALAASYRPISLLSVCYKLLERLLLSRIAPLTEEFLTPDQAGFRPGRSTCEQVLALSTHIENGFQKNLKTGAVFVDLTAAYDTVWHRGLLVKISRCLPPWVANIISFLLQNRRFRVHLGDKTSRWRRLSNGLPQGSVLAPTLFNIYINDLPETSSRKFIYADDICCATQAKKFDKLEETLTKDMTLLSDYCRKWRLTPSAAKTVSSVFHLHHASSLRELNIQLDGKRIRHEAQPVYLGVTLDRTLSFHEHLKKTAAKVGSRNNIIARLAGSTWGASASTLRTSALALCYSAAEYCAPVWCRSPHVHLVDSKLNSSMRTISGTIHSTPAHWLPVLSNIVPPAIRREAATSKLTAHINARPDLPIHADIFDHPAQRLTSRHPIWFPAPILHFSVPDSWKQSWQSAEVKNKHLITDPCKRQPGFDLVRYDWVHLNRYRTGHGRCAAMLHRWGARDDPNCPCGIRQTMNHIVNDCHLTRFEGGLETLHQAQPDAVEWLRKKGIR